MDTDNKHLLNRVCSTISPGIVFLFMLILICIAYSNSLYSPLVLDDRNSFIEDPNVYVKDFSISSLKQLSHTRFGTKRVIPMISFALDHHIGMGSIIQFHITNILVHIAATCFLYFFLTGIVKTDTGAKAVKFIEPQFFCLFITALWAFHPIQTNCVTYIVQRMASLAALFYLASLAFYIHARINRSPVTKICLFSAALVAAALSFMSKENAFTLPAAMLLVELLFISPNLAPKIQKLMKWHYWLILIIIILALLPLGENYLNSILNGYNTRHFTLPERLLTQLRIVVFYISLL
ncbi:MAG: hypothetical protein KAR13_19995, partial [Desulfobulbaceae bacterium]|nr:hypothetical protein [Desulfobulbaceae bacterium]